MELGMATGSCSRNRGLPRVFIIALRIRTGGTEGRGQVRYLQANRRRHQRPTGPSKVRDQAEKTSFLIAMRLVSKRIES